MTKITQFDRAKADAVAKRVEETLQSLATELGIQIKRGRGSYGAHNFSLKLEMSVVNADGHAQTRESDALALLYPRYVGFKFIMSNGLRGEVVGYRTKAPKKPFLVAAEDGRTYICTQLSVDRAFNAAGGAR